MATKEVKQLADPIEQANIYGRFLASTARTTLKQMDIEPTPNRIDMMLRAFREVQESYRNILRNVGQLK